MTSVQTIKEKCLPQKNIGITKNSTHKYIEIHLLFVNIGVLHYVQNLCCKRRHVEQQIVKTFFTFEAFILTPDKVRIQITLSLRNKQNKKIYIGNNVHIPINMGT